MRQVMTEPEQTPRILGRPDVLVDMNSQSASDFAQLIALLFPNSNTGPAARVSIQFSDLILRY